MRWICALQLCRQPVRKLKKSFQHRHASPLGFRCRLCSTQRGERQRRQDRDDRAHHQQFDEPRHSPTPVMDRVRMTALQLSS